LEPESTTPALNENPVFVMADKIAEISILSPPSAAKSLIQSTSYAVAELSDAAVYLKGAVPDNQEFGLSWYLCGKAD